MTLKWSIATAGLAACLSAGIAFAQEPTPPTPSPAPADPAPAPADAPPPAQAAAPKERFFGDKFALYLEFRGGIADADAFSTPIVTTSNLTTETSTQLEDVINGEFTVGWTLPRDRGQYLFTYHGISDGGYELDSTGYQRAYIDPSGTSIVSLNNPAPWWSVRIRDGQLRSTQRPPTWDGSVNDTDGDGFPDDGELTYPTTAFDLQRGVPEDLGTQLSTYDLYYRRGFGGTRYHARWTAGMRYLTFDGALPMPMWVSVAASTPGTGFSEGVLNPIMVVQQDASGWGPVGSGEMQFNFFRRRLQLYGLVRVAFLMIEASADSHTFEFLARDVTTGNLVPRQGHFETEIDKTAWNTTFEAGVRFRILEGFHVFADWNKSGYLDPMVLPTRISLPQNSGQVDQPIGVSYKTDDVVLSIVQVGLSFQF